MNEVTLIGKSGSKAELRYTQAGKAILSLSIVTNEKYNDKMETYWHHVVVFGKTAEIVSTQIDKGTGVFIKGKICPREYTDKSGNKRKSVDIIALRIHVLQTNKTEFYGEVQKQTKEFQPIQEEDIPF